MGAPLLVVACEIRSDGVAESQAPCVSQNETHYQLVTREIYALDVAQGSSLVGALTPMDAAASAQAFGIGFTAVVFCWMLGKSVGVVLDAIKKL
ncbi:MAG: hypothetical protein V4695_07250 [Pseudomonadota bacterium]